MAGNGQLEGKYMQDLPAMFGKAWTANITKHPQSARGATLMANWPTYCARASSVMVAMLHPGCPSSPLFPTKTFA
ncbi:MAG: hypothetical protein IPM82_27360 [Saprospiraceae bacterium]|nr:hypothetical protein [Saprospiraceae bacterium]